MSFPLACVALVGGFILLIWAGDLMVRGAAALARHWGIPALIVGLTIVAFGTSAPEMVVSIGAVWKDMMDPALNTSELAIGNVIGSNIANVLLVLGVPALIMAIPTNIAGVGRNTGIAVLATLIMIILMFVHEPLARWQGAILFAGIILYLVWMFGLAKAGADDPILQEMQEIEEGEDGLPRKLSTDLIFVVFGIIGLAAGGKLIVESASIIAAGFGVSDAMIGLTIVAIGTSLPELATVVLAAYRGHPEVAIGNVLGSNVFNIFAVLGAAALVGPVKIPGELYVFDIWVMLAAIFALMFFILTRVPISRKVGIGFVIGYLLYIGALIRNAPLADPAPTLEGLIRMSLSHQFELEKDFQFEAAHYFAHDDANEAFKTVHGHSFKGTVFITGPAREDAGWIKDLWKIDKIVQEVVAPLDHALLNDVEGLPQPALEQIAKWIFDRLEDKLPGLTAVEVGRPSCGERARIRKTA